MRHYGPRYRRTRTRFKEAFQMVEGMRVELYATWSDLKAELRAAATPAEVDAAIDRAEARVGYLLAD